MARLVEDDKLGARCEGGRERGAPRGVLVRRRIVVARAADVVEVEGAAFDRREHDDIVLGRVEGVHDQRARCGACGDATHDVGGVSE